MSKPRMTIAGLRRDYRSGAVRPVDVIDRIFSRIGDSGLAPVWISLVDRAVALNRAREVDLSLPLAGIPFAVKDNIDVLGVPTTAACPAFAYDPARSATVVERLTAAGAIVIGKTNLDQFATGLVGTRSPYGRPSSVFDERYISGGSSSGSAVAVAQELAAFALGTDTAGSGRVPAAFNGLVGLKPTRGLLSTSGVVPACRSLDCVSVFAATAADAYEVWGLARAADPLDPYSRVIPVGGDAAPWTAGGFRFGVPRPEQREFFGDVEAARAFERAIARCEALGGVPVAIDFAPFQEAAQLLYAGPWVAERLASVGQFVAARPEAVDPVVREVLQSGWKFSAVDGHRAASRLQDLVRDARDQWRSMDVLLLPTAPTIYTTEAVRADPIRLNTRLGHYTNFANLMDLSVIAVPADRRSDGLPFGVSFVAPAFADAGLLTLAARWLGEEAPADGADAEPGCVRVAVVGAHLSGQPLNHQLVERGARLVGPAQTAARYRLFALGATAPAKPGLVRVSDGEGASIELEVWTMPESCFGGFVAAVPPPLAIGSVELKSGARVCGFVCEAAGLAGAEDITRFGGWRAYLTSRQPS